jgi:alpha-D-ribose 1-methylphosphonate 5-triphosphate diphosphatase PhnM
MNLPSLDAEAFTRLEKLAVAVARHDDAFEAKVREKQQDNSDFAFLSEPNGTLFLASELCVL